MNPERSRWWMYVVAPSFLAVHALYGYLFIFGSADLDGLQAVFDGGTMQVRAVAAGTALAQAGLRAGDRVLAVGGLPVRDAREWGAVLANLQTGRPQSWNVLRGVDQVGFEMVLQRATRGLPQISYAVVSLSFFSLGLLIGFRRPNDPVARIGAWLFMTMSAALGLLNGWAVIWRQLPILVQGILWIPEISRFVIEGIFLSFFLIFPRRMFRTRWPWFVIWLPVLATLPWRAWGFYSTIYRPGQATAIPGWLNRVILLRTMLYLVAALVVLVISYRHFADLNEKRRVRVLMGGTAIGLIAAIPIVSAYTFWGYALMPALLLYVIAGPFTLLTLACPFAFAYAILRHRVFDIEVIIRQGLQYALARGAVLGVVPALGAILILDLAINSAQPLADILRSRGWIYAVVGGLALLCYWQRKQWLERLDRRFFRERYDAQRVLREVAEEIRQARSVERVAPRVVARVETALHPEFISMMVREPGGLEYCSLVSVPSGYAVPPFPADSKLIALVAVLGKPLEVLLADSAWLEGRLPKHEIELVRRIRVDLLVPIAIASGRTEALLALGIKRSEEPYTREDQELLEVIASSLALLLDQPGPAVESAAQKFEECPACGMCYEPSSRNCSIEGAALTVVQLPRTLGGRYRLERRRGRGGMGTVYESTDTALERRVAVKVIREDLVSSPEAAQRFRRESRAAAGFSHPNVVTVHDYGVEASTRAFLVMELLKGVTLRDELALYRRLDSPRMIEIFRGVCAATDAAHRRQLVHRDLKPENIFLAQSENATGEIIKVLDFGIAKFLPASADDAPTRVTAETSAGVLVGTPAYMSPEQLLGESPSVSWDLWALAVVAYETLTGSIPFGAQSLGALRRAIVAGNFTPLSEHVIIGHFSWQPFFETCFAVDRSKRPRSVTDFFHRLEETFARRA